MIFEMAPLEGLTTFVYRRAYAKYINDIDVYYTPFISLHRDKEFNYKELRECSPEYNQGMHLIPQVLTNSSDDYLRAEQKFAQFGYTELNINFGCPSGTVTAKAKGSGMLADLERLQRFLDEVFEKHELDISIKTRIGMKDCADWEKILEIYNQYPLKKLIIHPRVRQDFYNNVPNKEAFAYAMEHSKNPLCYNGDIFHKNAYETLLEQFPTLESVMLGRGLIANPGLVGCLRGNEPLKKETLRSFYEEIYDAYSSMLSGDKTILFRMKEFWLYMLHAFENSEKYEKKIKKMTSLSEYKILVDEIFRELPLKQPLGTI